MSVVVSILKWLGIGLLAIILLLLGLIFIPPWFAVMQDEMSSGTYVEYLEDNHFAVSGENPEFGFSSDFYQHRIFLLSEIHGYAAPQELDFQLLKHLNEQVGVRYYLAEMDPAQAMAVNIFLELGDDTYLRDVFEYYADNSFQWGNREFFAKIERIRDLNETLPAANRIYFIGVDRLYDTSFAKRLLILMTAQQDEANLSEIESYLQTALGVEPDLPPYNEKSLEQYPSDWIPVQLFNAQLALSMLQKDELGSRYSNILSNIQATMKAAGPEEKFYGLWGIFHGIQVPVNEAQPLAMRLEAMNEQDEVVTVAGLYADGSLSMMPSEMLAPVVVPPNNEAYTLLPANNDDVYLYYMRGIRDLKKVAGTSPVTIFDLAAEGSPYRSSDRLMKSRGFLTHLQQFEVQGNTADAVEYIALFQGSPALTP
ncbi:hypothetical protein [Parvularcula sp. IMCC14364]|uniref:hypothetical protein n=1 Tax=Parvularcula sp. IMCC14364 TaxID=3067902 RepID=UPI0027423019|nr:hypothetical protein [Parvularcula sp. IMCC14364]